MCHGPRVPFQHDPALPMSRIKPHVLNLEALTQKLWGRHKILELGSLGIFTLGVRDTTVAQQRIWRSMSTEKSKASVLWNHISLPLGWAGRGAQEDKEKHSTSLGPSPPEAQIFQLLPQIIKVPHEQSAWHQDSANRKV